MCGERSDANHFLGERWRGKLGKQIWNGGQRAELGERRGGVGRTGVVERWGTVEGFELEKLYQL